MKALSVFADMIASSGQEAQVSMKIWVDVNDPATLIDGDNSVEYLTLGAAVVARDNLPADRINGAKIKCGARIFTADEIERLYHRPASKNR
jgi:hypothetical protein